MSAQLAVRELPASEFDAWDRLNAASPQGSPYSAPAYLDALCTAAGGSFRILAADRGGQLAGGIGVYERDTPAGRFVSPRLLLYYLSPVLAAHETKYPSQRTAREVEVLGALADALVARGYGSVTLKCRHTLGDVRPFLARGWSAYPSYSYVMDLADRQAAWGRVEQNLRRLVTRCTEQGITMSEDDDFAAFNRLHELTLGRKGAAVYLPAGPFRAWFERLRAAGLCRLYHARMPDGKVIASQLVLTGSHPLSHTVSAAADPAHLNLGVNAFLRWRAAEALSTAGFTANDLTDAALNPVTHFKGQLGGDLVMCHVVESPRTVRWKMWQAGKRGSGEAKRIVKRLLGRGAE
jgi:GNAT acetyltransferase-like protein